jgi:hypothetical protein
MYYSTARFKIFIWNLYQKQLEVDTETCKLQYLKENV